MQFKSKRVAAIHDLSCFGRSSLTVVIPVFAKMGIQVCPLPTALLSTHGAYEDGTYLDLTDQMRPIINHWKTLDIDFDVIYSGFLGSADQIDIVLEFLNDFKKSDTLVVVDPVMGDEGRVYSIIDSGLKSKMTDLVKHADIITPNTTEACLMLSREYKHTMTMEEAKIMMRDLADLGPEIVILTSIHSDSSNNRYTGVFNSKTGEFFFNSCRYFEQDYPGTGDGFTSVFIGAMLRGHSLEESLTISLKFIEESLDATEKSQVDPRDGINLEIPHIAI